MSTIFISYRRDGSGGHTGRLFDPLSNRIGGASVFRDIDDIEAGIDFVDALEKALGRCDVLLFTVGRTRSSVAGPKHILARDGIGTRGTRTLSLLQPIGLLELIADGDRLENRGELMESGAAAAGRIGDKHFAPGFGIA